MSDLSAMEAFAAVARGGSFSAASRALGVPKSTISRQVAALEARLGCRLLLRTSRRVALTDVGVTYLEDLEAVFAAMARAEARVVEQADEPRGSVRLSAPMSFGQRVLGGLLAAYLEAHPNVSVEVVLTDATSDLVAEGFDLAIRIRATTPPDSSLITRRVAAAQLVLCASPDYLRRRGVPLRPSELSAHSCLLYTLGGDAHRWRVGTSVVPVEGRLIANNGDLLRGAAVAGVGICRLPRFIIEHDLAAGRLVEVLADHPLPPGGVFLVWPQGRFLPKKTRSFIDFAVRWFVESPELA